MKNNSVFVALSEELFASYTDMSDSELLQHNAMWLTVDSCPGYPCRVSLQDAQVGEQVLALSFTHHDVASPYKAAGPIFVRKQAKKTTCVPGEVPTMLRHRCLSLRGYTSDGMMIDAGVVEGRDLENHIITMFDNKSVEYIHVHNAKPGCFNCEVRRV